MVTVTTVIPCYNCEEHIETTLKSVLNQTLSNIEVICVDNNSTDTTRNILNRLAKIDPRIIVSNEAQAGANYARNKGLQIATGEFIQFLDSDDVILPNKFEIQCGLMAKNGLDLLISDRAVYDENLEHQLEFIDFKSFKSNPLPESIARIIITGNPIYRTEFVRKIGGYLAHLTSAQDWEFHIRCFLNNPKFDYHPAAFLHSRKLSNSLSSDFVQVSNNACTVIELYKEEFVLNKVYLHNQALNKILYTYLVSYIYSGLSDYKKGFNYWYSFKNKSKVFNKFNRILIKMLGANLFLNVKRSMHLMKAKMKNS